MGIPVTSETVENGIRLVPVHATLMWATSEDGQKLYKIEHAGAWDGPDEENDDVDERRSGCYYEDDDLPAGAISLYRVTEVVGMVRRRSFDIWWLYNAFIIGLLVGLGIGVLLW